ncbi:MAG: DUF3626 domain-containing protein [Minicystis sp.]
MLARGSVPLFAGEIAADLGRKARVTLSFHPDRLLADGRTVIEALVAEGRYRSQFETGISNGSRTAYRGGERDRWEEALFGGAYQERGAAPAERPRYGGLDVMRHADGASPRFGSCYLVLRSHVAPFCTFTWGDSHLGPEHVGTLDAFEPILAAMLASAETQPDTLGVRGLTVPGLVERLASLDRDGAAEDVVGRALDGYIEAQVHGDIALGEDVEALVIDPAFAGTTAGEHLHALGARYGLPVRAHPGFVLAVTDVPPDFRGPRMVPLAARLAARFSRAQGELDAVVVGRAAASLHRAPQAWEDWGKPDETLQHLKQMWHVLVAFGRARRG